MHDLACEEIGHRRKTDMRMRPDVDALARRKRGRTHEIEEDDRPDVPYRRRGQQSRDREAAEVAHPAFDDRRDSVHEAVRSRVRASGGTASRRRAARRGCPSSSRPCHGGDVDRRRIAVAEIDLAAAFGGNAGRERDRDARRLDARRSVVGAQALHVRRVREHAARVLGEALRLRREIVAAVVADFLDHAGRA